jgi:hypothetical protein
LRREARTHVVAEGCLQRRTYQLGRLCSSTAPSSWCSSGRPRTSSALAALPTRDPFVRALGVSRKSVRMTCSVFGKRACFRTRTQHHTRTHAHRHNTGGGAWAAPPVVALSWPLFYLVHSTPLFLHFLYARASSHTRAHVHHIHPPTHPL